MQCRYPLHSAANLNIHLHPRVFVEVCRTTEVEPQFVPVGAPTIEQLQALLKKLIQRLMRLLTRLGTLVEEDGMTYLVDPESDTVLGAQKVLCLPAAPFGMRTRGVCQHTTLR